MALAQILADFQRDVAQCESLIANAHQNNAGGAAILPAVDREQITVAAFLNFFIAWESFLESAICDLMVGGATTSGSLPTKFVAPPSLDAARKMVVGVMRFFDFANHDYVRKIAGQYFQAAYPFEPHLSAIVSDLADLRTMRNSCAHISSTTQQGLESLALRIFSGPRPAIRIYQMLTSPDPRSATGDTVFVTYKNKIVVTAELIKSG